MRAMILERLDSTRLVCRGRAAFFALLVAALAGAGCGDDPFASRFEERPDTAVIYSLDRPELTLPSAFNFYLRSTIRLERPDAAGRWDIALDTRDGELFLITPETLGISTRTRIARLPGTAFGQVEEAPGDTARYSPGPVPLSPGATYVVRADGRSAGFSSTCIFHGKLEPLTVDPAQGALVFQFDVNDRCNDRRLVEK